MSPPGQVAVCVPPVVAAFDGLSPPATRSLKAKDPERGCLLSPGLRPSPRLTGVDLSPLIVSLPCIPVTVPTPQWPSPASSPAAVHSFLNVDALHAEPLSPLRLPAPALVPPSPLSDSSQSPALAPLLAPRMPRSLPASPGNGRLARASCSCSERRPHRTSPLLPSAARCPLLFARGGGRAGALPPIAEPAATSRSGSLAGVCTGPGPGHVDCPACPPAAPRQRRMTVACVGPLEGRACTPRGSLPALPATCSCPLNVLIADDHRVNRVLALRVFSLYCPQASVRAAEDGGEAAAAFAGGRPVDVAVLDIEMPVLDGIQAAAAMRREEGAGRRARLVAWSTLLSSPGEELRRRCAEAGFDATLPKPCPPLELLRAAVYPLQHGPACALHSPRAP